MLIVYISAGQSYLVKYWSISSLSAEILSGVKYLFSYLLSAVTIYITSTVLNMVLKAEESVHVLTNVKCVILVLIFILLKCSLNQDFSVRVLTILKFTISVQLSALLKH